MTESHLQGIIEKAAGTLQWELHHEVVKGAKTCRITSDPHGRRHIIHLSDHPVEIVNENETPPSTI